jgi:murein L,D-transpeptidase YafK
MSRLFIRSGLIVMALALAGCNGTLEDIAPKAERKLPERLVQQMKAKGMSTTSPIMVRIFKEEAVLEVWKQTDTGRFALAASYDICKWSGKLGPKFTEGDRQAPEGFYTVAAHQMNPNSSYHLAFNIGFPNSFDRANARSGSHLMVHGACSSAGCYSMTDEQMEQIYAFARDAFRGGQTHFQVQAFPFRMTPQNMARYKGDPNYQFWTMLKEGYDHFEITKVPPKVDVCDRRYVFNQVVQDGRALSPTQACPIMAQPEALQTAYRNFQTTYEAAFTAALDGSGRMSAPAPTIAGLKEAALVADWSRRRARGERVSPTPPSLGEPVTQIARTEPQVQPAVASAPVTQAPASVAATAAPQPSPEPMPALALQPEASTQSEAAAPAPAAGALGGLRSRVTGGLRNLFGS